MSHEVLVPLVGSGGDRSEGVEAAPGDAHVWAASVSRVVLVAHQTVLGQQVGHALHGLSGDTETSGRRRDRPGPFGNDAEQRSGSGMGLAQDRQRNVTRTLIGAEMPDASVTS